MTSEQPDTLDALYSGGMLTGKVILGVITVLLFCRYYEFVMSNIAKNSRYAFAHPISFGKKQTLLNKFFWFVMTPFLLFRLTMYIISVIMVYF